MAVVGWILLGLLGVILTVLLLPVRIKVECLGEWRGHVFLFGIVPVASFPAPPKEEQKPKESAALPKEPAAVPQEKKPSVFDEFKALLREEGIGGVLLFFKRLSTLLKGTLASVTRFITIRKLALCVRVGGEEADDIAVRYGQLSAALAASLTTLSNLVRVRRPKVRVVPDFTADKTDVKLRLVMWVWPFGVICAGLVSIVKLIALWFKTMKTPSDGADNTEIHKPLSK